MIVGARSITTLATTENGLTAEQLLSIELLDIHSNMLEHLKTDSKLSASYSGAYLKDRKLHVNVIGDTSIDAFKTAFGDNALVEYHLTDITFDRLYDMSNHLLEAWTELHIGASHIDNETITLNLSIADQKDSPAVIEWLLKKGYTESEVAHVTFTVGIDTVHGGEAIEPPATEPPTTEGDLSLGAGNEVE